MYQTSEYFSFSFPYSYLFLGIEDEIIFLLLLSAGLGLLVFLDIVHSYAAPDEMIGLSHFDGTNDCYFHTGKLMVYG